ncbi:MAG TPA: CBS domain-containing protein [Azospirillaceae bacterium]|nr:CBS domain-containing protein [Azospirillaceae bacterium]
MPRRKVMPDVINQQNLTVFPPTASVREAARAMAAKRIGAVLVVEGGALAGIFTERDLAVRVVAPGRDPDGTMLSEVMTGAPDVLRPDATAYDALSLMEAHNYRHLPVMDDDRLVGIVSIRDLFAVVKDQLEQDVKDRDAFIFGTSYAA